jgi:hypothetical protein
LEKKPKMAAVAFLLPLRFLATLGHFLLAVMVFFSRVSLPACLPARPCVSLFSLTPLVQDANIATALPAVCAAMADPRCTTMKAEFDRSLLAGFSLDVVFLAF